MHAERDIILPIAFVCLSNASIVLKRMDISSHILTVGQGHHSSFCAAIAAAVTKFQWEPLIEVLNTWGQEKFAVFC